MNLFNWLLFGLIVGVIAHMIDPEDSRGGILGTTVLGIVGAMVGGFLASTLFGVSLAGFDFTSLAVATAGSLLVLTLGRTWKHT